MHHIQNIQVTHIALRVARFSSKNASSIVKNLQICENAKERFTNLKVEYSAN